MLEQGARQEEQMTRQGHKTNQTGRQNTYSATSTGSDKDSDRRGENDNEPAKTIGQGAQ